MTLDPVASFSVMMSFALFLSSGMRVRASKCAPVKAKKISPSMNQRSSDENLSIVCRCFHCR